MRRFQLETVGLDLPALAVEFGSRLQEAGVPVGVDRCAGFAQALSLVRPISRGRLYWTARTAFVTDRSQLTAFNSVFAEVFGRQAVGEAEYDHRLGSEPSAAGDDQPRERQRGETSAPQAENPARAAVSPSRHEQTREREHDIPTATIASDEERLRGKRFESLSADELAELYRLMAELRIAVPTRSSRRARQDRHGPHVDLRRTMRASMRSGGDPIHLARRRRPRVSRRIVMLCDISGSMEPYARAYLQFLTSAAGSALRNGGPVEAFVFATRLTRLTRALQSRSPERAIQRAAAAAPDWSSGTRIGEALRRFNDRYGRRGMARGAVIVILSDGWERGDPTLVRREMERLSRLAYRIVWVNPRAAAPGFAPKAAGMVAALPYIDALVSGESLAALEEVVRVIGCAPGELPERAWSEQPETGDEPWGSATPVTGSSVAMPSGWSPSRGKTTPGW